jgi:hypothetical protein
VLLESQLAGDFLDTHGLENLFVDQANIEIVLPATDLYTSFQRIYLKVSDERIPFVKRNIYHVRKVRGKRSENLVYLHGG